MKNNLQAIAIQNFQPGEGLFIRSFFSDNDFNLNGWAVTKTAIKRDLQTGLKQDYFGKTAPIIMTERFGHPPDNVDDMIAAQERYRVGNFLRVGFDNETERGFVDAVITDKIAIEMLQNGELNFVSPSIRATSEIRMGDGRVVVPSFIVNHLALVKNPAYGVFKAQIKGRCTGTAEECLKQLSNVQASVKLKDGNTLCKFSCGTMYLQADFKALSEPIQQKIENGDALDKQDLLSLMGEDSTEQINIEQDTEIMKHRWYDLPETYQSAAGETCVSKWIPELKEKHKDWSQEQVVAVAFSKCGESKKGTQQSEVEDQTTIEIKDADGYIWPKDFGAEFKYEPVRGFYSGDTEIYPRIYVNEAEGHYLSKDHFTLHAMNLPHTHCYAVKQAGKITKYKFKSNYESDTPLFPSEEEMDKLPLLQSNMTEDDTYKYLKHNPGIFIGFAEALKPIQRKEATMPEDDNKDKDKEMKEKYEAMQKKAEETEKELKDTKDKLASLEAALQATVKGPIVTSIVQARVKLGTLKEAEVKAASESLMKQSVENLTSMQAEYSVLTSKFDSSKQAGESEVQVRYQYQAAVAEDGKTEKPGAAVSKMILSRCHS